MVSWFAGLFYIGRLFVYHKQAIERKNTEGDAIANQLGVMERKLYKIIMWPGMIGTIIFGLWYAHSINALLQGWVHNKLTGALVLVGYQLMCGKMIQQLASRQLNWSDIKLKFFNEIPAILLVYLVVLVYTRANQPALLSAVIITALVSIGIFMANRKRKKQ